jgi:16S rRNA C1402 (ribose-2'-O) methylase RsmI
MSKLLLIPWHVGDIRDITLNTMQAIRRLRVFVVEDVEASRLELGRVSIDPRSKVLWALTDERDETLLSKVLGAIAKEDVGLLSSGGTPCFIDPGSWLVAEVRRRGIAVTALAGASALSLAIALGGEDLRRGIGMATMMYPLLGNSGVLDKGPIVQAAGRGEAVYLFPNLDRLGDCLDALAEAAPGRQLTAFFDLTKTPPERYPNANKILITTCGKWRERRDEFLDAGLSEVALLLHPREVEGDAQY